jgi:hypothetical protein
VVAATVMLAAVGVAVILHLPPRAKLAPLSTRPASYIGLFSPSAPNSYAGVASFTAETGVSPNIVTYYSGWFEPFRASFARSAAQHGAVPLVQINPAHVSVAAIAAGRYDRYLAAYARSVRAYGDPVILSFGHEMNGTWYSWGRRHTPPAVFVAAWRHIVRVFRAAGARNVTWLWTVNVIKPRPGTAAPAAWWPGRSYVNWVGIDGYYYTAAELFTSAFGPTIAAVRELTQDPILISETAAPPSAGQPAKIASLFAGVRAYGLLGFIWFDATAARDYRITSPAAIAAFRRGAATYSMRVL